MRYFSVLASLLLAAFFSTCFSFADDQPGKPRNIAVVSQFENTMYKIRVGLTVFNNSEETHEVPDWHIAENSEADMVALLKMKGVAGNVQVLPQSGPRARAGEGTDAEQAAIIQAARDAGFDTLILIQPSENSNYHFFKPGYGVGAIGHITGLDVCPYAAFMVVVYRTADAKRIDWRWGYRSYSPIDFASRGPCTDFEKYPLVWKDALAQYTDEELTTVETAVKDRIRTGMERALDGLDLE